MLLLFKYKSLFIDISLIFYFSVEYLPNEIYSNGLEVNEAQDQITKNCTLNLKRYLFITENINRYQEVWKFKCTKKNSRFAASKGWVWESNFVKYNFKKKYS